MKADLLSGVLVYSLLAACVALLSQTTVGSSLGGSYLERIQDRNQEADTAFDVDDDNFEEIARREGIILAERDTARRVASRAAKCGNPFYKPSYQSSNGFTLGLHVVGGRTARAHSWPWQCRLITDLGRGYISLCGASVLDSQHVVTAAHCVVRNGRRKNTSKLHVTCGDHYKNRPEDSEQRSGVAEFTVHEAYNKLPLDSDIAVIKLTSPLVFNNYVQPICLPDKTSQPSENHTDCFVTGWGRTVSGGRGTTSDSLQQVKLPTVGQDECKELWTSLLTENMLCAGYTQGGKSSCQGDSGGPFVCKSDGRWELHGIVSWGHRNCAQPNFPSVFVRVARFTDWIQDVLSS